MTYEENLLALLESYKAGTIDAKTALEKADKVTEGLRIILTLVLRNWIITAVCVRGFPRLFTARVKQ
jgi:hypothetical protein